MNTEFECAGVISTALHVEGLRWTPSFGVRYRKFLGLWTGTELGCVGGFCGLASLPLSFVSIWFSFPPTTAREGGSLARTARAEFCFRNWRIGFMLRALLRGQSITLEE